MALSWHKLSVKIRRRETPIYERLCTVAKAEPYLEAHREVDAGKYPVLGKSDRC
jgi:hypothetical protein